jgi:PmbA protein
MKIKEFANRVIEYAKKTGFTDSEIYYSKSSSISIGVYKKEIDKYSINKSAGIGFRGIYNEKTGYSFTEIFDDESVYMLVDRAKESAEFIDSDEKSFIYFEKCDYEEINSYSNDINSTAINEKKKVALELEEKILKSDSRIYKVARTGYGDIENEVVIINSKGLNVSHKSNAAYLYSQATAKDKEKIVEGSDLLYKKTFAEIDSDKLANKIVTKTLGNIGAKELNSGNYKIILDKEAASQLLETFIGIFSAEAAQKGLSLLKDKENQNIGKSIVNIVDDPLLKGGLASRGFDDEGVPTYKKYLVKDGVLKTLLHNMKTANKQNIKTTANASKANFKSPISVAPTNCYIENGDKSLNDLLDFSKSGLLVKDFSGLHSGTNTISGDFSVAAKGFYFEDSRIKNPVEQFTLAGNFYDLLKSVILIANDIEFNSDIVSPSLYVGEMSVASK